ncbi:coiled-coil domain-containing protein [Paenibacillus glycanilyticus]|uniref:Membrane-bound metallopeptidase n=1 Tax=Paenibacillus glycanilyticus TaxID=126569 RepID=A0ABQ6GBC1_9BACL|nr:hypothetical protein [Paenibacillus glycanilyticus]GLX68244.1 hypothetical protein MU1_25890 [Paenibacillus glycanilyticus]
MAFHPIYVRGRWLFILLVVLMLALCKLPVMAEPQLTEDEQANQILEKSLSIVEIDKEITRIQAEKQKVTEDMSDTDKRIAEREQEIKQKREDAGKVLRAYYMGEREVLLRALLSFDSLHELFAMLDYVDLIFKQDRNTLDSYTKEYTSLKEEYTKLGTRKTELEEIENKLQTQRSRVAALEKQIDGDLAGRSDADRLRLMMQELTHYWETAGLAEVESYFDALSKAMNKLPSWLENHKQYLDINGFNYTIHIPADVLNDFLREQDERFKDFAFSFEDGKITASGNHDNMEIAVGGHYTVEETPKNGIVFHVDELLFNGFALPDTTRKTLEEKFDLGFYPGDIISFIQAKSVEVKNNELIVYLKMKL